MTVYEKPQINSEEIKQVISKHLDGKISALQEMAGGNLSRVYAFAVHDQAYVIKFSDLQDAYSLDPIITDLLSGQNVPYPACIGTGSLRQLSYVIQPKLEGKLLQQCTAEQRKKQLPELFRLLWQLNHADIASTSGYGWIKGDGNGKYDAWQNFVIKNFDEDQTGTFWEGWYDLFDQTILEKDVFEECYQRMLHYMPYNAPHRYFVHGDFHPYNILSDGKRITGIIDGNFIYGDFLIDLAILDRHMPQDNIMVDYSSFLEEQQLDIPQFEERMKGAYYYKGLDMLRFYAKMAYTDAYFYIKQFLLSLDR